MIWLIPCAFAVFIAFLFALSFKDTSADKTA